MPPEHLDSVPLRGGVVVALAAAIAAAVVGCLSLVDTIPREVMTRNTMSLTEYRLRDYARLHGRLPATISDLPPLAENRDSALTDGWGRPLQYFPHGRECLLLSLGRDGLPGGAGDDADLRLTFSLDGLAGSRSATTRESNR